MALRIEIVSTLQDNVSATAKAEADALRSLEAATRAVGAQFAATEAVIGGAQAVVARSASSVDLAARATTTSLSGTTGAIAESGAVADQTASKIDRLRSSYEQLRAMAPPLAMAPSAAPALFKIPAPPARLPDIATGRLADGMSAIAKAASDATAQIHRVREATLEVARAQDVARAAVRESLRPQRLTSAEMSRTVASTMEGRFTPTGAAARAAVEALAQAERNLAVAREGAAAALGRESAAVSQARAGFEAAAAAAASLVREESRIGAGVASTSSLLREQVVEFNRRSSVARDQVATLVQAVPVGMPLPGPVAEVSSMARSVATIADVEALERSLAGLAATGPAAFTRIGEAAAAVEQPIAAVKATLAASPQVPDLGAARLSETRVAVEGLAQSVGQLERFRAGITAATTIPQLDQLAAQIVFVKVQADLLGRTGGAAFARFREQINAAKTISDLERIERQVRRVENAASRVGVGAGLRRGAQAAAMLPGIPAEVSQVAFLGTAVSGLAGPALIAAGTVATLAAAVGGVVAAAAQAGKVGNLAEQVTNLSARTGVAAGHVQALQKAFELRGVAPEALATGLRFLNQAIAQGDPLLVQIGVTSRDTETAFLQLADAFAGTADDANKVDVAQKLLGRGANELIPVLNAGGAALRNQVRGLIESGAVMSGPALAAYLKLDAAADALSVRQAALANAWREAFIPAMEAAVPAVSAVVVKLTELAKAITLVNEKGLEGERLVPRVPRIGSEQEILAAQLSQSPGLAHIKADGERYAVAWEQAGKRIRESRARALRGEFKVGEGEDDLPLFGPHRLPQGAAAKPSLPGPPSEEVKRFAEQVAEIEKRLRGLGTSEVDALAEAFLRGEESVASLLRKLKDPALVTDVASRAQQIEALRAVFGDMAKDSEEAFGDAAQSGKTLEDRVAAIHRQMVLLNNEMASAEFGVPGGAIGPPTRDQLFEAGEFEAIGAAGPVQGPQTREDWRETLRQSDTVRDQLRLLVDASMEASAVASEQAQFIFSTATEGISSLVNTAIFDAQNFGRAMSQLFKSIIADAIALIIKLAIIRAIMAALGGGSGAAAGTREGAGAAGGVFPMAKGGIATRPTLALVGEAGPEAIVPLDRLSRFIAASQPARDDERVAPVMLARGGVVSRPTLAVIGEAGPEAVVPLERLSRFIAASRPAQREGGERDAPVALARGGIVSRPTLALVGESGPEAVAPLAQLARMVAESTLATEPERVAPPMRAVTGQAETAAAIPLNRIARLVEASQPSADAAPRGFADRMLAAIAQPVVSAVAAMARPQQFAAPSLVPQRATGSPGGSDGASVVHHHYHTTNIEALDLGTAVDSIRSPRGTLRRTLELEAERVA